MSEASKLEIPGDAAWTFKNTNVAENFDAHVNEQLPWYRLVTDLMAHVGRHYLTENSRMYDIGASTGNVTRSLTSEIEARNIQAISIDNSQAMQDMWRGVGEFQLADARAFDYQEYSFGVCFLVLMFLPPNDQKNLLDKLYDKLENGGCLLIVDRTAQGEGYLGTVMQRLTMANKLKAGASPEDILKKEMSLAGIQRPIKNSLLAPYNATEVFRMGDFAAWVITK